MDNLEPCEMRRDHHALITITLAELIDDGVFTWQREHMLGVFDALGSANAQRLQNMFTERYMWREISVIPPNKWMQMVGYKIKYELVPKYKPMYDAIANGDYSPLNAENEYYKARNIDSDFPETMIGGFSDNEVYATFGTDREYQRIKAASGVEVAQNFASLYADTDTMLINELSSFFTDLWSVNYNGF